LKQLQKEMGSLEIQIQAYEEQEKARLEKEKVKVSWYDYLFKSREPKVSEEETISQEQNRFQALASRRIKTSQLQAKSKKLEVVQGDIARIAAIRTNIRTYLDKNATQRIDDIERVLAEEDEARQRKAKDEARENAEKKRREQAEKVRQEQAKKEKLRQEQAEREKFRRKQAERLHREQAQSQNDSCDPSSGWEDYVKERRAREEAKEKESTGSKSKARGDSQPKATNDSKGRQNARDRADKARRASQEAYWSAEMLHRKEELRQSFEEAEREARAKKNKKARESKSEEHWKSSYGGQSSKSSRKHGGDCSHSQWWNKKIGPGSCAECSHFHKAWLMECPQCQLLACTSCMHSLKNGGRRR
jgi:hypothetical protein